MKKFDIDISSNKSNQIHKSDLKKFDKVIVMAEEETIPNFLKIDPKFLYWKIDDPKHMDKIDTMEIIKKIEFKIDEFVKNFISG